MLSDGDEAAQLVLLAGVACCHSPLVSLLGSTEVSDPGLAELVEVLLLLPLDTLRVTRPFLIEEGGFPSLSYFFALDLRFVNCNTR